MWILSEKVTLEDVNQNSLERRRTSPGRSHIFVYLVKIKILLRTFRTSAEHSYL